MTKESLLVFETKGEITSGTIRSSSVLDALNVVTFGKEVADYIRDHHVKNLLLDFRHVNYLSSAVLTELIRIKEMLEEEKGNLRLCALNEDIKKVFEITNLDTFFVIYDSADDAVKRFVRSLRIQAQDEAWADELPEGQ
jgi:anti-sigma B factor antagonist